ncbi:hypothetical protein FOA52_013024 [Chlamydomonas sp. UWO 241]|nr:hypothetical protein FOA52_013024 [Chlamydomonas sp. UWO 241]
MASALAPPATAAAAGNSQCVGWLHGGDVPGYEWLAGDRARHAAQVNGGEASRLRVALDRFLKLTPGDSLNLAFVGGSVTAGQGAVGSLSFPSWAEDILKKEIGDQVHLHNGGLTGHFSAYMSLCYALHVPQEADIIFVDYAYNDDWGAQVPISETNELGSFNSMRRPYERLLRKLLSYPRNPAVVLIHSFVWNDPMPGVLPGTYYHSAERDLHEFATYYQLQELSVKAGAFHLMQSGTKGFQVNHARAAAVPGVDPQSVDAPFTAGHAFYFDALHPDGATGHRYMGEIVAQLLLDALAGVHAVPVDDQERAAAAAPLVPPMLEDNWQSGSDDRCYMGGRVSSVVSAYDGWALLDAFGHADRPKPALQSSTPHASLRLTLNTSSSNVKAAAMVPVEVVFVRHGSGGMGRARVSCVSGCICTSAVIDGHLEGAPEVHVMQLRKEQETHTHTHTHQL